MSITRINTNYDAMFAANQISKLEASISRATARLSSGNRINSASDDPSSIAPLSYATGQMRGNRVAVQNIQEAKALAQFTDSALSSVEDKLLRMRDVSARLANDATLSSTQVTALQNEFTAMADSFSAANVTTYKWNGKEVLNAGISASDLVQVGPNTGQTVSGTYLSITGVDATSLGVDTAPTAGTNAANMISTIDGALSTIAGFRSNAGVVGRLMDTLLEDQLSMEATNAATVSTIGDADMASEVTKLASAQVLAQAGAAMLAQANAQSQLLVGLL